MLAGCCEHGNGQSVTAKVAQLLTHLSK